MRIRDERGRLHSLTVYALAEQDLKTRLPRTPTGDYAPEARTIAVNWAMRKYYGVGHQREKDELIESIVKRMTEVLDAR